MRDDGDFAAYMAARGPPLVRTLVLLGSPVAEAEAVVSTALGRCYASWARVRREEDVDVHVYRAVLDGWERTHRHHGWPQHARQELPSRPVHARQEPVPSAPGGEAGEELAVATPSVRPDPLGRKPLLVALEAQLETLQPNHRAVLVLRVVGGLEPDQVADVLGVTVGEVVTGMSRALAHLDLA